MNIIFGTKRAEEIGLRHIVLELDTFTFNDSAPLTSYCVVENVPLETLPIADKMVKLHESLIRNYNQKKWTECEELLEQLDGAWGLEMDTFYSHIKLKIEELSTQNVDDWSPIIQKQII